MERKILNAKDHKIKFKGTVKSGESVRLSRKSRKKMRKRRRQRMPKQGKKGGREYEKKVECNF